MFGLGVLVGFASVLIGREVYIWGLRQSFKKDVPGAIAGDDPWVGEFHD